jgi:hypothetical protein
MPMKWMNEWHVVVTGIAYIVTLALP